MEDKALHDFETYKQIMGELLSPIPQNELDVHTLKKLYESKLVYLQNLRVKCFYDINSTQKGHFSSQDYALIFEALLQTRRHLKALVLESVQNTLK